MEEHADLGRLSVPKALKRNGVYSLPILARPDGPAELKQIPIFVRRELVPLYNNLGSFLGSSKSSYFHLTGPPGTGKTSFVTLVCRLWVAQKTSRRLLFISYRSQRPSDVVIFEGEKVRWYAGGVEEGRDLASVVRKVIDAEKDNFDLCVFDGVRNPDKDSDCKAVLSLVNGRTGKSGKLRRSITITSMSFRDRDIEDMSGHIFDSLDSWTLERHISCFQAMLSENKIPDFLREDILYYAARKNEEEENNDDDTEMVDATNNDEDGDELLLRDINSFEEEDAEATTGDNQHAQIENDLLLSYVEDKYFYAGGSARFMYSRAISALKNELERLIELVEDWTPFATNDIPSSNLHATNSLMQQFKSSGRRMAAPVSRFVLMRAYEKCESTMIAAIRGIADSTGNASLQGWAFELEELEKVKTVLKSQQEYPRHLETSEQLVLYPKSEATYDGSKLTMPRKPVGLVVIWCLKWNQGCFDIALFLNGQLVTLQFTTAASHSLKLEHVSQLRSALLPHGLNPAAKVFHWFVVRDGVPGVFKHDTPTGTGRKSCKLDFTVSVCKSTRLKVVEGEAKNTLTSTDATDINVHSNKKRKS